MRMERRRKKHKYLINFILIFIISGIIIWIDLEILRETNIKYENKYTAKKISTNQMAQNIVQNRIIENTVTENIIQESKITDNIIQESEITENIITNNKTAESIMSENKKIVDSYKGFEVCGILEIPKINLETYILKNYSEKSLKVSVTKFWGVNPNEIGNCCIAGHNFKNKNMFHNIKKLVNGDRFYITDSSGRKIEYEVYNVYKVEPKDVSCLSQKTNFAREITLITCTNDSALRIIVKAKELGK